MSSHKYHTGHIYHLQLTIDLNLHNSTFVQNFDFQCLSYHKKDLKV